MIARGQGLGVDCGDCFFDFGEKVGAGGGESWQEACGCDALDADVVGIRAGVGGVRVRFDAKGYAFERLVVDGVEEFDGYQDLVAGLGRFEEDDGFEVVAECDPAAIEVNYLRHGAVGVGAKLEPDAGAGDVVAVQRLRNLDLAAIPDGVLGRFGWRGDDGPSGVVEGEGFAVREIADVDSPVSGGQGVEGFNGVQLLDRGGREILLLANWREGLSEESGTGEQARGK